ncbi:hypothetical protein HpHCM65_00290 [Helicobacter pylori]
MIAQLVAETLSAPSDKKKRFRATGFAHDGQNLSGEKDYAHFLQAASGESFRERFIREQTPNNIRDNTINV